MQNPFLSLIIVHRLPRWFRGWFVWDCIACWPINLNGHAHCETWSKFDHRSHYLTLQWYLTANDRVFECLCFPPLAQALTMVEYIPLVHLSKAFSAASYVLADDVINSEVDSRKSTITKARFWRMLGFGTTEGMVDPNLISSVDLIHMFYQMGYNGELTLLSKFKKSNISPVWNGLFTL